MDEEPTKQQLIEACLEKIAEQADFPAFSHHIQEVMRVIEDENASTRRLTNMVLRDFSLTLRVLRMANSVCFNRSERPVVSVAHAIALLGTEAIRDLAGGIALFEYYRKISPGLRELMLLSLLTANQTRAVAGLVNYPRREEAYICGMFRNLGEVLIACYFPRKYAAVLTRMSERTLREREASLQVLQFTYEDLGQAMAKHWGLPDRVAECMTAVEPPRMSVGPPEMNLLKASVAFSHALTNAVYRREPEGAPARINLLIQDYFPVLGLRREDVGRILDTGIIETKTTFSTLSVPLDELRLRHQAETALAQAAAEAPVEDFASPIQDVAKGEEFMEHVVRDVGNSTLAPGFDLHGVILMILEALYRGGPFDRVLFCLADADHTEMHGRLGLGEGIDMFRERFRAPISARGGLIGTALVRRQDLFIAGEGSYAEAEALRTTGARCLGIYPILVDGILGGCLYFDRITQRKPPNSHVMDLVAQLRDLATQAIAAHRPG